MNWQAVNAACAFYTLGRCWSTMRDDRFVVGWIVILAMGWMVLLLWPALWLLCAIDLLARRWRWFALLWCRIWRMHPSEYGLGRTGDTNGER